MGSYIVDFEIWKHPTFGGSALSCLTRHKKILSGCWFGCKNILNFIYLPMKFHNPDALAFGAPILHRFRGVIRVRAGRVPGLEKCWTTDPFSLFSLNWYISKLIIVLRMGAWHPLSNLNGCPGTHGTRSNEGTGCIKWHFGSNSYPCHLHSIIVHLVKKSSIFSCLFYLHLYFNLLRPPVSPFV